MLDFRKNEGELRDKNSEFRMQDFRKNEGEFRDPSSECGAAAKIEKKSAINPSAKQ